MVASQNFSCFLRLMYVCITSQNKALILNDPVLLFFLRPADLLNSLICYYALKVKSEFFKTSLVMVGCLFSLLMKLSRTFFVNIKFHSAYKSVIGDFHKKKN